MKKNTIRVWSVLVLVYVLASGLLTADRGAVLAQQPPPAATAQDDGFVPVKDLGDQEQLPAAPLVIGAYSVAWVAIFVYLWSIWRRLSRVEGEIAAVSRRIEAGARPGARQ